MKTVWSRLKRYVDGGRPAAETLNLTDPATITGFIDIAREMRAHQPVCPVASGGVLLLESEDVALAFSNPSLSNQPSRFSALAPKNKEKYIAASVASHILPFLDGPRHIALRQWASRAFFQHQKSFAAQIDDIAAHHVRALATGTEYVLVEDVARRFVVDVIGKFIGVDLCVSDMKTCTTALFRLFAPAYNAETFAQTNAGLEQARQLLADAMTARRAEQTACLLNALDATYPEDLDQEDRDLVIIDNALLFLADGVENVEAAVGIVMMRYGQSPQEITPEFVRSAISDDTPGQTIARVAADDIVIGGTMVTTGTPVFLSLSSANDSSKSSEEFTFGRGRHKCLGESFAIAIVTSLCRELASRKPIIQTDNLVYEPMFGHKWPRRIAINLTR